MKLPILLTSLDTKSKIAVTAAKIYTKKYACIWNGFENIISNYIDTRSEEMVLPLIKNMPLTGDLGEIVHR